MTLPEALEILEISDLTSVDIDHAYAEKYNELKVRLDNSYDEEIRAELEAQFSLLEQARELIKSLPSTTPISKEEVRQSSENAYYALLGLVPGSSIKQVKKAYDKKTENLKKTRNDVSTPEAKRLISERLRETEYAYLSLIDSNAVVNEGEREPLIRWLLYFFGILALTVTAYFLLPDGYLLSLANGDKQTQELQKKEKRLEAIAKNGFLAVQNSTGVPIEINTIIATYWDSTGVIKKFKQEYGEQNGALPLVKILPAGTVSFRKDTLISNNWNGEVLSYSIHYSLDGKEENIVSGLWQEDRYGQYLIIKGPIRNAATTAKTGTSQSTVRTSPRTSGTQKPKVPTRQPTQRSTSRKADPVLVVSTDRRIKITVNGNCAAKTIYVSSGGTKTLNLCEGDNNVIILAYDPDKREYKGNPLVEKYTIFPGDRVILNINSSSFSGNLPDF